MRHPRKPSKPALQPRRCRYCKAVFTPKRPQDIDARFCEPNHRKAYHKYGGLPYDKMREQIRRDIRAELAPLLERIEKIESLWD